MFNTPRKTQFTGAISSPTFDPLAAPPPPSGFTDVDPWSGTQSPARSATPRSDVAPRARASYEADTRSVLSGSAEDARGLPAALVEQPDDEYLALYDGLSPSAAGTVSTASVQRLVSSSGLPASTLDKVDRADVFAALALTALAQASASYEPTLESLAALSYLPAPSLRPANGSAGTASSANGYAAVGPPPSGFSASPWDAVPTPPLTGPSTFTESSTFAGVRGGDGGLADGESTDAAPSQYKRLENVDVSLVPEKEGWFLQKYKIESDKRAEPVFRRYSDFAWLADTLTRRYPFRLLPALPPKRLNPDVAFLEQRRRALGRFIIAAVNHPVLQGDGALGVFMSEPNFEAWRKRVKVSTEEESASKRLSPAEEMAIPADLEAKLDALRTRLPDLIAGYQKMVVAAERALARLQQSSADAARLALALGAAAEAVPETCHRCVGGGDCALCRGVAGGLRGFADAWERVGEAHEQKAVNVLTAAIEALKTQRDLYTSFRDLFVRHERLSKDNVDALRKKVDTRSVKVEALKGAQKPGWELEVDKLVSANEQDNGAVLALLARRVFIRACLWHELSSVAHARQAAQATQLARAWAAGEAGAARAEAEIWDAVAGQLAGGAGR